MEKYKPRPLKRLEHYLSSFFKFGRTSWLAKQSYREVGTLNERLVDAAHHVDVRMDEIAHRTDAGIGETREALQAEIARLQDALDQAHADLSAAKEGLSDHGANLRAHDGAIRDQRASQAALSHSFTALTQRMDRLLLDLARDTPPAKPSPTPERPADDGFDLFKDHFYHELENRYRGAQDEISRRLRVYMPDVEAAVRRCGGLPVMDIGCGRGEWLRLLEAEGISAFGVDTNSAQIDEARAAGFDVHLGDALAHLAGLEDNSLSMITAHHVIEHLPFDAVAWMTREAIRVLAPGGVLLYETPHTGNVLVGATTFHTDPTHLKPMPEQVMSVLLDVTGFDPVTIRRLNPHERLQEFVDHPQMNPELAHLLFGPQDLSILGQKPQET